MTIRTLLTLAGLLTLAPLAHASSFEIDKQSSRIEVDVKATGHHFTGQLKSYACKAECLADGTKPTAFELKWKFKDLDTDNDKRDKEMMHWLGGADPEGSFKLLKVTTDGNGKPMLTGVLGIHGITKQISFPYTVESKDGSVVVDGQTVLNYQDFDLPIIRAMLVMTVDPELVVRFHLVGKVN